jgi:hypothetical protein
VHQVLYFAIWENFIPETHAFRSAWKWPFVAISGYRRFEGTWIITGRCGVTSTKIGILYYTTVKTFNTRMNLWSSSRRMSIGCQLLSSLVPTLNAKSMRVNHMITLNCMLQTGPPPLHYYCAVVLQSCIVVPQVGHSSNHEYHCCQLTDIRAVFWIFYRTFRGFIWLSLVLWCDSHVRTCAVYFRWCLNTTTLNNNISVF